MQSPSIHSFICIIYSSSIPQAVHSGRPEQELCLNVKTKKMSSMMIMIFLKDDDDDVGPPYFSWPSRDLVVSMWLEEREWT